MLFPIFILPAIWKSILFGENFSFYQAFQLFLMHTNVLAKINESEIFLEKKIKTKSLLKNNSNTKAHKIVLVFVDVHFKFIEKCHIWVSFCIHA